MKCCRNVMDDRIVHQKCGEHEQRPRDVSPGSFSWFASTELTVEPDKSKITACKHITHSCVHSHRKNNSCRKVQPTSKVGSLFTLYGSIWRHQSTSHPIHLYSIESQHTLATNCLYPTAYPTNWFPRRKVTGSRQSPTLLEYPSNSSPILQTPASGIGETNVYPFVWFIVTQKSVWSNLIGHTT